MRRRRCVATFALCIWVLGLLAGPASASPSQLALPKAYALVDVDTGAVVAQQDARAVHLPASTIKLLTALIAAQRLTAADPIAISPVAEGMPARKINVKAGQVWAYDHLMHSMLMVSANDAAVALAEKVGGGSLDGYVQVATETAQRLGLADQPVLNDPAGLDDEFSHDGGNRISARDLAIVARAVMMTPSVMNIVNTREYSFTGGDLLPHHITNHNLFLDLYQGANGLKTGTTDLAGHTFVGSATRGGRTMLAVVFDAPDSYGSAGALLDQGFNTPVASEATLDHLPPVVSDASLPPPATLASPEPSPARPSKGESIFDSTAFALFVLVIGLLPLAALRRRVIERARLHDVPDEIRVFGPVEEEMGGVMFVDVADEAVVDPVPDEFAQSR